MRWEIFLRLRKQYARVMEPVCRELKLTRNELDVLLFLANHPECDRAADIVEQRGIAKSHASLAVSGLGARGLLTRRLDRDDRRTVRLGLTPAGEQAAHTGRARQKAFFEALLEGITPEEQALFQVLEEKIRANAEKMEAL